MTTPKKKKDAPKGSKEHTLKTLGGRSTFTYWRLGPDLYIRYGRNETEARVSPEDVSAVETRYKRLQGEERTMTSRYTDRNWPDRPHRILSPYVARVIHFETTGK